MEILNQTFFRLLFSLVISCRGGGMTTPPSLLYPPLDKGIYNDSDYGLKGRTFLNWKWKYSKVEYRMLTSIGTPYKVTCPVYAALHMYTGQVTFFKVP